MINRDSAARVANFLRPEHFYEQRHIRIYERVLRANGRLVDHAILKPAADQDDDLRELGGSAYLEGLARIGPPVPDEAEMLARDVHDLALKRTLVRIGEELVNRAYDLTLPETGAQQIADVRHALEQLAREQINLDHCGKSASEFTPLDTAWAWYPYLPAGMISILAAKGGARKGLVCTSFVAAITSGVAWPDGQPVEHPGNALWCEAEDPTEEVLIPRMIAAKADRSKIKIMNREEFEGLADLGAYIAKNNIKIIVLSPLLSFLPKLKDKNDEMAVRDVLERLQSASKPHDCAAVGICHTAKKPDLAAIERILGSVAFSNFVRSVLLLATEDDHTSRMIHAKHNLSVRGDDRVCTSVHVGENPRSQFVKLDWSTPDDGNCDVDAVFDRRKPEDEGKPTAGKWLVRYLKEHGESLRADVILAGEIAGFKESAIDKARQRNKRIHARQDGFHGPYLWCLKGDSREGVSVCPSVRVCT
jgi:hypothetical protein